MGSSFTSLSFRQVRTHTAFQIESCKRTDCGRLGMGLWPSLIPNGIQLYKTGEQKSKGEEPWNADVYCPITKE